MSSSSDSPTVVERVDGQSKESTQLGKPALSSSYSTLRAELLSEIQAAAQRIYQLDQPTPCLQIPLVSGGQLLIKREDQSRVHSYKWRGAFNKIAWLLERGICGPMITASAGNHAQGVALAAAHAQIKAHIFMPRSTPILKQEAVKRLGGNLVEIQLVGDYYDDAARSAEAYLNENEGYYLHPFDDLQVIAGQATIGLELDTALAPDIAFLQIGGGGMAAGVAAVLRERFPQIKIIGVEEAGQNSMQISLDSGCRRTLSQVSHFCDGTAVATPGRLTHALCAELLDAIWTVNEQDVCTAIEWLWNELRVVVEPSAGIGVAAALIADGAMQSSNQELMSKVAELQLAKNPRMLTVLSGSNVDFMTLSTIARKGRHPVKQRRFYAFEIAEAAGTLIGLLDQFLPDMNIVDFQYGKTDLHQAFPVIGVEAPPTELDLFEQRMSNSGISIRPVNNFARVEYRVVPFQPTLTQNALFATIEFPDRPGALAEFMRQISGKTNLCYFNYCQSGQEVSQALMGFEFESPQGREKFRTFLAQSDVGTRTVCETIGAFLSGDAH